MEQLTEKDARGPPPQREDGRRNGERLELGEGRQEAGCCAGRRAG